MRFGRAALALPALLGLCASQAHAQLVITPTYNTSITSDPNATTIENTINSAIQVYEQTFSNPVTVTITFGEMSGGLGQSSTFYNQVTYTQYRNALIADKMGTGDTAFLNYVPVGPNNPVNGSAYVNATTANLRVLGLPGGSLSAGTSDSTITLNTSIMNLSRSGTQNPNFYDLQAVASHEIDEALGISSALTSPDTFFNNNAIYGLDLYRYSANGVRSFTTSSSATAYFSVNGGQSAVLDQYGSGVFFNQSGGGADYNDWAGSSGARVQDAFGTPGSKPNLGPGELRALQSLGYNLAAPEPSQTAALGIGLLGLAALGLRARRRTHA